LGLVLNIHYELVGQLHPFLISLLILRQEGHVFAFGLHLLNVFLEHTDGVLVQLPFLHLEEGCFEKIHIGVNLFLLPLIEAFALFWRLVWNLLVDVAEELRHPDEVSARLPVLPANFASREQSSKVKGK
jgi:hypothetical protein